MDPSELGVSHFFLPTVLDVILNNIALNSGHRKALLDIKTYIPDEPLDYSYLRFQ